MKQTTFNFISVLYDETIVPESIVHNVVSQLDRFCNNNSLVVISFYKTTEYLINFEYYYKPKYNKLIYVNTYNLNTINEKDYLFVLKQFDELYELYDSNSQFYHKNNIKAKKFINFNYVTIEDLRNVIYKTIDKIPNDCDVIVGVPRSGMLVATMLSLFLNKRLSTVDNILKGHVFSCGNSSGDKSINFTPIKKILVVEDSVNGGSSINYWKEKFKNCQYEVAYYASIVIPDKVNLVDSYSMICTAPRVFEWNLNRHFFLNYTCVDIDGVLCADNKIDEVEYPDEYESFIKHAPQLIHIGNKIDTIVTNRLEKYRNITQQWLNDHNIQYNNLIMAQYINATERRKDNKYGEYKGNVFKNSNGILFIESSLTQAEQISNISKKPVICTDTNQIIYPNI